LDVWEIIEPCLLSGKDGQVLRDSYPDMDEAQCRRRWQQHWGEMP
jgi:hypothetical protein